MYFIVTDDRAFSTPEITGTMKQEAQAGNMVLINPSHLLFYGADGEWRQINQWVHPFADKRNRSSLFQTIINFISRIWSS